MSIEQKAREIAEQSIGLSNLMETPRVIAARLGIIEGLEMAAKVAESKKYGDITHDAETESYDACCDEIVAAIRSLK